MILGFDSSNVDKYWKETQDFLKVRTLSPFQPIFYKKIIFYICVKLSFYFSPVVSK